MELKLNIKKLGKKYWSVLIGAPLLILIAALLLFLQYSATLIVTAISIGIIAIALPYFAFSYIEYQDLKKAEDGYPNFLRDLTQAVNSGMTIPQAIATVSQTDYGALSKYVRRLNAWLSWSLPFPQAWKNFTELLKKSEIIQRINGIILESFEAGGDIGAILLSLSEDVDTIKRMEADKRTAMLQHLGVMYVVFFVFLGIIIILHKILLPVLFLQRFGAFSGIAFRPVEVLDVDYFKNLFFLMTVVQAVCLGVLAGQILEEKLIAGFKHVVVMLSIGVVVFSLIVLPTKLTFNVEVSPQALGIGQSFTVSGRVFFDEQPAGGANIQIVSPTGEVLTLIADSLGEFSTTMEAPTQPGSYQITVVMTHETESRTIVKTITVS